MISFDATEATNISMIYDYVQTDAWYVGFQYAISVPTNK